ncbi:hypothetical protein BH10BAC4_BH10BAC4_12560 [soil metagenome]
MTKKTTSPKKSTKRLSKKLASMKMHTKIVTVFVAAVVVTIAAIGIANTTAVEGAKDSTSIPLTASAQASVSDVSVTTIGNTINVQFDYDLANGATTATVDAALSSRRSFNSVNVTGPGHYYETLTDVADGTYYIGIAITGNPQYVLGDAGPANKTMFITIPDTQKTKNGDPFIRHIRKFFHSQSKDF